MIRQSGHQVNRVIIGILFASILPCVLLAQDPTPAPAGIMGIGGDVLSISGDIGTYGELYSISGRDKRRPASTGRLYFRPTVSVFDAFSMSFNFLLSTEGSSRRQQINQIGVRPQWGWGYANAGDFSESYTPLTLNGLLVRGGSVTINPGLLRFSAVGGWTQRAAAGSATASYDRYIYGGRIGVGEEGGSFFDIIVLRAKDNPDSFQPGLPDTSSVIDSTQLGTRVATFQDTPQENLVVGVVGAVQLFDNLLSFDGEFSGSAYTRDLNSAAFDNDKVPSFIKGIFTPRLSTSADYAYTLSAKLNLSPVAFKAGYRYIGPGYNSLGVASLLTDQREILLGAGVRFARWGGNVSWSRQNDNLVDQKLYTTVRQSFNGTFNVRPADTWNINLLGNVLTMRNYAARDTARIDFTTFTLGTSQTVVLGHEGVFRTASVNYIYQKSSDGNPLRVQNGSQTHTVSLNALAMAAQNFTVTPAFSLTSTRFGSLGSLNTKTFSLTPQYRTLDNKLVLSLSVGLSNAQGTTSLLTNLTVTYPLTSSSRMTLSLRNNAYSTNQPGGNYSEQTASLTITQRF